jgi:hypothetical protein
MQKKLVKKLKEIQADIQKNSSLRNLDTLASEAKKAFDDSLENLLNRENFLKKIENKKVQLKEWKIGVLKTISSIKLSELISAPIIYAMIIPLVAFHFFLEVYHQVCFRLYGIPLVKSRKYFVYDRHLLPYLNWVEKVNCLYCSYGNNLMQYGVEILGRTERYWCPIKYAKKVKNYHSQYTKFAGYLDAKDFRDKWQDLKKFSDIKAEDKAECDYIKKKKK